MINFFFFFSKNQKKTYQNFRFYITHFLVTSSSKITVRKKTTRIQISFIPKCEFGCVNWKLGARVDIWKSIAIALEILSRAVTREVPFGRNVIFTVIYNKTQKYLQNMKSCCWESTHMDLLRIIFCASTSSCAPLYALKWMH